MNDQELNEAVARKLGWEPCKGNDLWQQIGHPETCRELSAYSTDIRAAWECFGDREWRVERVMVHPADRNTSNLFRCAIRTGFDSWATATADTAPLAICKAFLKLP